MSDHAGDDPIPRAGGGPQGLSTSRLRGVLDGTYATKSLYPLPTGITGSGRYNGLSGIYNGQLLRHTRAKLAAAASGGIARIACIGNSITEGVGSASTPDATSYPAYLSTILNSAGVTKGGTGWIIPGNNNVGNRDSRLTLSGTWNAFGSSWENFFLQATANGNTATYTSNVAGTVVEIAYINAGSGQFTYAIDGGTAVTITPTPAVNTVSKVTVTGLTNTTHTVVITALSSSTYLASVQFRGTSGAVVSNLGVGGSQSSAWTSSATFYKNGPYSRSLDTFDLVLVEAMFINDATNAISAATSQANLANIVSTYAATGADVAIIVPPAPQTTSISAATWLPLQQACYAVADSAGVPLFDVTDRQGDHGTSAGNGLKADAFHLSSYGYYDVARMIASALLV